MKYIIGIIILLFFGLIQSSLLPLNLILILVILFAGNCATAKESFVWAFIAGIVRDLLLGSLMGVSSAAFLVIVFFLQLYGRKFKLLNLLYLLPFNIIIYVVFSFIFKQTVTGLSLLGSLLFFIILYPLVKYFFIRMGKDEDQLSLNI